MSSFPHFSLIQEMLRSIRTALGNISLEVTMHWLDWIYFHNFIQLQGYTFYIPQYIKAKRLDMKPL